MQELQFSLQTPSIGFGIENVRTIRGEDGEDGYSPVVTVTSITGGHRVAITDATHIEDPHTFDVMDGQDGADGEDGAEGNGIASIAKTSTVGDVDTYTITFTDGTTTTFTVTNGSDGDDGTVFTPSVSEAGVISWTNDGSKPNPPSVDIVAAVIAALPTWTGGSY